MSPSETPFSPAVPLGAGTSVPFQQAPHSLLAIPGPVEITDAVLYANAHPSVAHTSPPFIKVFGECLSRFLTLLRAPPTSEAIITAGSGTLGWDHVASNLVAPGDQVLVLSTGYFGDAFADCLRAYGVYPDVIEAPVGRKHTLSAVREALKARAYDAVLVTHVDTSTGVLSDAQGVAETVRAHAPQALLVLDGVCSVGSERIEMDKWGYDVVLTASQKGLGCPPGLMLLGLSPRAMERAAKLRAQAQKEGRPARTYFADWQRWLPIMRAYRAGQPAYFATPATNLIYALHQSLSDILPAAGQGAEEAEAEAKAEAKNAEALEARWAAHVAVSNKIKGHLSRRQRLGQLVHGDGSQDGAHGMTAVLYPAGVEGPRLLAALARRGVVAGTGLHKACKTRYFRLGHMGVSVTDGQRGDADRLLAALDAALKEVGWEPSAATQPAKL